VSGAGFAYLVSLLAGLAGAIQVAVNGALGKRIGVLETTAFGLFVSFAIVLVVVLAARRTVTGVTSGFGQPAWLWLGGVMGVVIVSSITFAGPRIGVFATVALVVSGQLAMGALIDALGLLGAERIPLGWTRAAGLGLLAAGAFLVARR